MLLALSDGRKIGLALTATAFIVFSLAASFLVPRLRPGFPGAKGLRLFVPASLALFAGMVAAVELLAKD